MRRAAVLEDATAFVGGGMGGGRCCPNCCWLCVGDVAGAAVVVVFMLVGTD